MVHSYSREAGEVLRASPGRQVAWDGLTLGTHFQPIYSVRLGSCMGYEALVRATLADGTALRPVEFFQTRHAAGQGALIDWICRSLHLRSFAVVDPGDRRLFLNVHPEAAVKRGEVEAFAQLVRFYAVSPRKICVEILENDCTDEGLLREAVRGYRDLGATIAMDDFGIGRSNFDRIVSLRPDVVKFDRSVLNQAVGDAKARRMLPAVIQLLHEAGAEVVIEGVESANEALIAMDAGADLLQGYYFAAPSAALPDEPLTHRIFAELLRMRGEPRSKVSEKADRRAVLA